jgi:hypothetical protein
MDEHEKKLITPISYALLAAAGFLSVTLITNTVSFKSPTFDNLYSKPKTEAKSDQKTASVPSGMHYDLNIVGVPSGKLAESSQTQGKILFVPLLGKCNIHLSQGDFAILDEDCIDGPASLQLPEIDPDRDGVSQYSVWIKASGKLSEDSQTASCAKDSPTGEVYCSAYSLISIKNGGIEDASSLLLTLYSDPDGDGVLERYPLFDDALKDYFWEYDNNNLKILQMRLYPVSRG